MSLGFRRAAPSQAKNNTGAGLPLAVGTGESANPDKAGLAVGVAEPAPLKQPPIITTPINKTLTWLINALQLQNANVPRRLNVREVMPVVDAAGFAGWGLALYTLHGPRSAGTGIPIIFAGASNSFWQIVDPDPVNTQVLLSLSITPNDTGANGTMMGIGLILNSRLALAHGGINEVAGDTILIGSFAVPGFHQASMGVDQAAVTLPTMIGPGRFVVAPPGYGIILYTYNTNGATLNESCRYQTAIIPGNFGAGR